MSPCRPRHRVTVSSAFQATSLALALAAVLLALQSRSMRAAELRAVELLAAETMKGTETKQLGHAKQR